MGPRQTPVRMLTAQECRERVDSLRAQVTVARALSETARELRQYNAELRELLRENRLMSLTLKERWMEEACFREEIAREASLEGNST